jgi:signal transduction histidine kinase
MSAERDTAADDVAKAAHDLNNLCARLMGFSALATEIVPPTSELSTYIGEIGASAGEAADLAEHLRAIALRLRATEVNK